MICGHKRSGPSSIQAEVIVECHFCESLSNLVNNIQHLKRRNAMALILGVALDTHFSWRSRYDSLSNNIQIVDLIVQFKNELWYRAVGGQHLKHL